MIKLFHFTEIYIKRIMKGNGVSNVFALHDSVFAFHDSEIRSLSVGSNNNVVSGGDSGVVKLWGQHELFKREGKLLADLVGHTKPVTAVYLGSSNDRSVSGDQSGNVKLWDIQLKEVANQASVPCVESPVLQIK